MEKLTVHTRYGYQIKGLSPLAHDYDLNELKVLIDTASRLAQYEDTGLSPEQVRKLKEKQTPIKAKKIILINYATIYRCPACDNDEIAGVDYCPFCGQKIDWD